MVAYLNIVTDVNLIHKEVLISNFCSIACKGGTADHYIFTDMIVVTNNQIGFFSRVVEVLRFCTKHCMVVYLITFTHTCTFQNTGIGHDYTVVPDFDIFFDIGKRFDSDILSNFCLGVYIS